MAQGKKYRDVKRFDCERLHTPSEALDLVDLAGQGQLRRDVELVCGGRRLPQGRPDRAGTVALPSGTGKDVRVAVFAAGEAAAGPRGGRRHRGRRRPGRPDRGGMLDFDVTIASPDLMPIVGRSAACSAPGLMPNPKSGTVTPDVAKAVGEFKGGKVEYRTDRYGNVAVPIGKASFTGAQLLDNFRAVLDELNRAKPASAKGRYLRRITVASTMGPGIKIDSGRIRPAVDEAVA